MSWMKQWIGEEKKIDLLSKWLRKINLSTEWPIKQAIVARFLIAWMHNIWPPDVANHNSQQSQHN